MLSLYLTPRHACFNVRPMKGYALRSIMTIWGFAALAAGTIALSPSSVMAQVAVPSASDPARVRPDAPKPIPNLAPQAPMLRQDNLPGAASAPPGAAAIQFTLSGVKLEGVTAYAPDHFAALYAPMLGEHVSLQDVYDLAARITLAYRDAGYLLSYATVPDQEISGGKVTITVVEGYLGQVIVDGTDENASLTKHYIARLTSEKPLRDATLESTLLRLNDLPGTSYRAVLSKEAGTPLGASTLTLIPSVKSARASVSFDNFASRFLGPHQVSASLSDSLLARHQTTIFGLTSIPFQKLNYLSLAHAYTLAPDVTVDGSISYTDSEPGYTLEPLDIKSSTSSVSVGINYQAVRQRDENLLLKLLYDSRHVTSDILNTALTRDDIRAVRASASYDLRDSWGGANIINATVSQGLGIFNASKRGEPNPSRSEADNDFTKFELSASRLQALSENWSALLQLNGQYATNPLYASEEFGYGGQNIGRAYDPSEIVGDSGGQAAIEVRYAGFRTGQPINIEPFAFYDYGFVTNRDAAQPDFDSLSSAGAGVRFATPAGQSGLVALAIPISRDANTPIYGTDSARLLFQITQNF